MFYNRNNLTDNSFPPSWDVGCLSHIRPFLTARTLLFHYCLLSHLIGPIASSLCPEDSCPEGSIDLKCKERVTDSDEDEPDGQVLYTFSRIASLAFWTVGAIN
jgi:hypothetical protein